MNQEQANRLSASLYRQMMYIKLLHLENEYFLKYPVSSGIKNTLKRMKDCYSGGINQIKSYLPKSNQIFQKEIDMSEEKAMAISNIIERLYMLDDETVLKLEDDFADQIKIEY